VFNLSDRQSSEYGMRQEFLYVRFIMMYLIFLFLKIFVLRNWLDG